MKRNTLKTVAACAAVAGLAVGCCADGRPGYDTLIAHRGESVDAPDSDSGRKLSFEIVSQNSKSTVRR